LESQILELLRQPSSIHSSSTVLTAYKAKAGNFLHSY
jgi:hypothetical protein